MVYLYIAHIYVTLKEETIFEVLLPREHLEDPYHPSSYTPGLLTVPTSIVPAEINGSKPPPPRHKELTDTMKNIDFIIVQTRCHATLRCHFDETYHLPFQRVMDIEAERP